MKYYVLSTWILVFLIYGLNLWPQESAAIINGYKVQEGDFPWHVGVYAYHKKKHDYVLICGGSLISMDLVISAAYCFYDEEYTDTRSEDWFTIIAGKYHHSYDEPERSVQESLVERIEVPTRYSGKIGNYVRDIALVRLKKPFTTSKFVKPIEIDWYNRLGNEQLQIGRYGKIAGSGSTRPGKKNAELTGIYLPYVSDDDCSNQILKIAATARLGDKFCAGYLNESRVCYYDIGGGLCYKFYGVWYLRGILSIIQFGRKQIDRQCNRKNYAFFTNVGDHLEWIRGFYDGAGNSTGCVLPEQPANGSYEQSLCFGKCSNETGTRVGPGSILTYNCSEGFTADENVVFCDNNVWTKSPRCIADVNELREKPAGKQWIGYVVSLVFILALIPFVGTWMCYLDRREMAARRRFILATVERFHVGAKDFLDPELAMADQAELLPYDKSAEFPRKLLRLGKTLGSGAFGIVIKAEAKSICQGQKFSTVAVKMVRATHRLDHMTALIRELKILAHLGKHLNVVNLLGACSDRISYGELFVIVEFCRFGNLRDYLLRGRSDFVNQVDSITGKIATPTFGTSDPTGNNDDMNTSDFDDHSAAEKCSKSIDPESSSFSVTVEEPIPDPDPVQPVQESRYDGDFTDSDLNPIRTRDLLCWGWQVSRGMKFLGSKRVVHGDLAARNILLADNNVVKICDFGLAKSLYASDIYKKSGGGPLPVKWMAIESIGDRLFSIKSDVWSFGVVLWEFFTLGKTPYPGMANESIYQKLVDGFRMEKPEYATELLHNTMLRCWNAEASQRPSFEELENVLDDLIEVKVKSDYLDFDRPYAEINAEALANGKKDYLAMTPAEYASDTVESVV